MYTSEFPQKICFQHHELGGYCKPYNMYIPLSLLYKFSCIHAYICLHLIFLHIFLSRNAWCILWMQRYGMTDKPLSYLTEVYSTIFIRLISCSGSDILWNWHLCQMFEYFYIFEYILPHLGVQYHIHHTFIIVSYTCAICHLHHYQT